MTNRLDGRNWGYWPADATSSHRRRLPNLLAALVAAMLAVLALASPAFASDGDDNVAAEVNTQDGSTQIDIAFDIEKVFDGIVDQTNAAVAYSSCEECQTIAIAIQVVLVSGAVDVVAPTNVSYAINANCRPASRSRSRTSSSSAISRACA